MPAGAEAKGSAFSPSSQGKMAASEPSRAVRLRTAHRRALGAAERVVELGQVRGGADGAPLAGAVRVRVELDAKRLLARLVPPDRREREEETLFGREAVDRRAGLPLERLLERLVGDLDAAEVADVLAERELAVDGLVGERPVAVELLHDERRAGVVGLPVIGLPPVLEVPIRVVLAARVVESVGHLVADDDADAAVVHGVVGVLRSEEHTSEL